MWSRKIPDKSGIYWFYGFKHSMSRDAQMTLIEVNLARGKMILTECGRYMNPSEIFGLWHQASRPLRPDVMFERYLLEEYGDGS